MYLAEFLTIDYLSVTNQIGLQVGGLTKTLEAASAAEMLYLPERRRLEKASPMAAPRIGIPTDFSAFPDGSSHSPVLMTASPPSMLTFSATTDMLEVPHLHNVDKLEPFE